MSSDWKHPDNLLWFVAGEGGPAERENISRHVRFCAVCREETAALSSMMKSMFAQTRLDHVSAEDLVMFEEAALRIGSGKAAQIQQHLEECAQCREDLETLSQARDREMSAPHPLQRIPPPPPPRPVASDVERDVHSAPGAPDARPNRRWLAAAAAGVVVMIALGVTGLSRIDTGPAGPVALKRVVLGAPQRGAESTGVIDAPGPWAVRVLLPYGTAPQTFRVTIRRKHQDTLPRLDTIATSDSEGCLDVIVPELPSPGHYELVLAPLSNVKPGESEDRIYTFEYVTSARIPRAG